MDVRMPDGTIITGVPDNITQADLLARYSRYTPPETPQSPTLMEGMVSQASARDKAQRQVFGDTIGPFGSKFAQPKEQGLASIAPKPEFDPTKPLTAESYLAAVAQRKEETPDRSISDAALDAGITLLKGAIGLPESFVGLADIPTRGAIGKFLEDSGYNPREAKKILDTYLSEAQQAANRKVAETEGFLPTVGAVLQNPSTIATGVGESLPQMIGGAGVARGILKAAPKVGTVVAGGLGEGILGAGSAAEQIRGENKNKLLTGEQSLAALGSGVGTAAFGVAGGRLAQKFGLDDVDTLLAGGASRGGPKSVLDFAKRATGSGISEGVFEEMPQSAQEKMWMNYATNKPLMDGVAEAMGVGLVTGFAMGAVGGGAGSALKKTPEQEIADAINSMQYRPGKQEAPSQGATQDDLESLARSKGFFTPQAPTTELLKATEPTKAPVSESQDLQAMLAELEAQLEGKPAPVKAEPVSEAPAPVTQEPSITELKLEEPVSAPQPKKDFYSQVDATLAQIDSSDKLVDELARMRDRQSPLTVNSAADPIASREGMLWRLASTDPEKAATLAQGIQDNVEQYSESSGFPPDTLKSFASQIVKRLPKAEPVKPKVEPARKPEDVAIESHKYDTPDLRLAQADVFGTDVTTALYSEMESYGRAALKNRSLTDGYAAKKDALADAADAAVLAFGSKDYSVFEPYAQTFPKLAKKMQAHLSTQTKAAPVAAPVVAPQKSNLQVADKDIKGKHDVINDATEFSDDEFGWLDRATNTLHMQYADGTPVKHYAGDKTATGVFNLTPITNSDEAKAAVAAGKRFVTVGEDSTAIKEAAAEEVPAAKGKKATKPKTNLDKVAHLRRQSWEKNPLMAYVADKGLYHEKGKPGSLMSEFNGGKQKMISGYGPVFKSSGLQLDALLPIAVQDGFVAQDATEDDLYSLIQQAFSNKRIEALYQEQGQEDLATKYAERMAKDEPGYEERAEQTDAEWYGMAEDEYMNIMASEVAQLTPEEIAELDASVAEFNQVPASNVSMRAAMEAMGFTEQEIQDEENRTAAKAPEAVAEQPTQGDETGQAAPTLELETQTAEELKAKQAEVDRLTKENERLSKQAEAKAKADAELGEFVLTGSDRAADVAAAQGQQDIFGAAEEAPAAPEDRFKKYIRQPVATTPKIERETNPAGKTTEGVEWKVTGPTGEINRFSRKKDAQELFDSYGVQEAPSDMAYHAGNLNYGRDTTLGRMMGGRGTGHFGTGVYFVGDKSLISGREGRPVQAVDLSEYKLAKPGSSYSAKKLHDALKAVNRMQEVDSVDSADGEQAAETLHDVLGNSVASIKKAMTEAVAEAVDLRPTYAFENDYIDSASTRLMKKLGYEGVDTRGLDGFDNTEFGTVVYAEKIEPKEKAAPQEAPVEAKSQKNTVTTPDGAVLRYPVALDLVNNGYQVLAMDNPRTYVDKGGTPHRTFEKGPLRIAMTPQRTLFQSRNAVNVGFGNEDEMTLEALLVDTNKRNQGLATQAMQDVVDAADKNGITLYLEPTPLVNLRKNDLGLDRSQLETFYNKFGFEFSPDSDKVMQREPQAEVLPAAEPQIAGQIANEPFTFEGEFTEIGEEQQRALITDQTANLSDAQVSSLEKFYGFARDTEEFADAVRQDVVNFITKGAEYVNGKIRAIIRSMANGVLSVAVAFNPQFVSQPYTIAVPQFETRTEQVLEQVPAEVQGQMSEDAKRAYATIYPAIKGELTKNDKFFIVADKQTANTFVFNPDGSSFMASKTLFGVGIGDFVKGDNNIVSNRITPAGLFDLGLRDAKRSVDEASTAGEYDFGKVFVLDKSQKGANGFYSTTIMHSVWTKEADAKQRLAALQKPGAEDSRYSFGCINVDKDTYGQLVTNNLAQMDGAKIFIVPENGKDVMSFVNGEATYSTDIIRQRAEPVTKQTKVEVDRAEQMAAADRTVVGREEEGPMYNSIEAETAGWSPSRIDQLIGEFGYTDGRTFGMAGYVNPADFVKATTPTLEAAELLNEEAGELDKNAIRAERQTPFLFWDIDKGVILDHEGRHRMAALARAGVTRAPVVLVVKDRYGSKKPDQYTPEDNVFLSGQGFQGGKGQGLGVNTLIPLSYKYKDQLAEEYGKAGFLYDFSTRPVVAEEKKRSPSFKRRIAKLNRDRVKGKISDEQFVNEADFALKEAENDRLEKPVAARVRGADFIRQKLLEAKRKGDLSEEAVDLAEWFIQNNEQLVEDLGISVRSENIRGVGGQYSTLNRVIILMKDGGSNLTVVHEILHHLERMMPPKVQQAIRDAWAKQLISAQKKAKTPAEQLYFKMLVDAHYGDNNFDFVEVPEGEMSKAFMTALAELRFENPGSTSSIKLAEILLKTGAVPYQQYQFFNPSEFWAVNGADIVQGRFDAVRGSMLARLKNWLKELVQKLKGLVGMNSNASIIKALDSLSKGDGQFVTMEMLGEGEYKNVRRNYEGNEAPAASFESPEESKMDNRIYMLVDKNIDLKRVIDGIKKASGSIADNWDAYLKEELYHGRSAKRTQDFLNGEMIPILEEMKEKGVTLAQFEEYLHMRHAEERNIQIAKVNPKMPGTSEETSGSGISTKRAVKYLAELTPEQNKTFNSLAGKFDKIINNTQKLLVSSGLETQDTIDSWNQAYEHYVPLMRDDLDFKHHGTGLGSGYSTKGGSSKSAFGSTKKVIDIFATVALQRERAIVRSEKARVGRALYGLAIKNPNPGFWLPINPDAIKDKEKLTQELIDLGLSPEDAENIIQEPKVATIDKKTGLVKYQVNPLMRNSDNVFPVRINGEDRYIFFNTSDPRAIRMVESLKNLDAEQTGLFLGSMGAVTRWMASVNTQYNPVFGAWNFIRDVQGAAFNLTTTEIAGQEKEVMSGVFPALRGIYSDLRKSRKKQAGESEWAKLFEQYQLAGGQTGYRDQFNNTDKKANIVQRELNKLDRGNVKKAAYAVFNWLSDYNDAMENAVRLSAFKVALDKGLSEERAASIAKNLTVNFNRKGAATPTLQALFAFFNAAVQGSTRLAQTLRGPAGKKIMAGGIAIGVFQALALAMAGYDDDDPPEFLKNKNLILPIPGGDYLIIPMPLGFNIFPGVGRLATEYVLGQNGMITGAKGAGDKLVSMGSLILDAFNPLGSGSVIQMVAPTVIDPWVSVLGTNRDAFGRPISKEDRATAPTPGYTRSRETASEFSKAFAEFLNYVSSPIGTRYTKGLISPTADQIDYLIGQYTGGVGREIMKAGQFGAAVVKGETGDLPSYKVPIVGKLYGETESPAAVSAKFYENVTKLAEHENEIKMRIKNKEDIREYRAEHPEVRFMNRVNNLENQITAINKQKKTLQEKDAPEERIKRLDERKTKLMRDFNNQLKRLEQQ